MKFFKIKNRSGFSMAEIVITTAIFATIFVSLIFLTSRTRNETSKAINYMRALQLAQEAVDLINSTPFDKITESNLSILSGSLVDPVTSKSINIPVGENDNNSIEKPKYPDEYTSCYFYRTIKIDDIGKVPNNRFLKKITIGIYWNEGKMPKQIESVSSKEPDRMRKLVVSTLIFNEKEYY